MLLLGPVEQAPSTDDPDAGLVEAATRIAFVVATTGVAALVVIGLLAAALLGAASGLARLVRRRSGGQPAPDQASSSST